jgi:hypothetical protein
MVKLEAENLKQTQATQGTISEMIAKRLRSEFDNSPTNPFVANNVSAASPAAELARGQQAVAVAKDAYEAGVYNGGVRPNNGFFYSPQPPLSGNPLPGGPKLATDLGAPVPAPSPAATPAAAAACRPEAFASSQRIMDMIDSSTKVITAQGAADVLTGGSTGTSTLTLYGKQMAKDGVTWNEKASGLLMACDGRNLTLPNGRQYDLADFWDPPGAWKNLPFRPLTDADKMAISNMTVAAGCGFAYKTGNLATQEEFDNFDPMRSAVATRGKKNKKEQV